MSLSGATTEVAWLVSKLDDAGLVCMLARAEALDWPVDELRAEVERRGLR